MRKTLLALSLLSLLAFVACGKDPLEEALEKRAGGGGGDVATGPALTATLKGKITFDGTPPTSEQHAQLHEKAHERCFIANSVNSEVRIEPSIAP